MFRGTEGYGAFTLHRANEAKTMIQAGNERIPKGRGMWKMLVDSSDIKHMFTALSKEAIAKRMSSMVEKCIEQEEEKGRRRAAMKVVVRKQGRRVTDTDGHKDKQTDRQTERQTDRQARRETGKKGDRKENR